MGSTSPSAFGRTPMTPETVIARQMRTEHVTRATIDFIEKKGSFEGKDITAYLKKYDATARVMKFSEREKMEQFPLCTGDDYEDVITGICTTKMTWEACKDALRRKYQLRDSTRFTIEKFLEWLASAKTDLPDKILRVLESQVFNGLHGQCC